MSCIEHYFKESMKKNFPDRHLIQARCAHITDPQPIHMEQGRNKCQNQNMCNRGCVYRRLFQQQCIHVAMGNEDRQSYHQASFGCSFCYL